QVAAPVLDPETTVIMSQRSIDLHLHSTASDGALTPSQLVRRAHERGIRTLSLTDHDTLDGLGEAQRAAAELEMTLIPGIELSCVWNGITLHVLGLAIDPGHGAMGQAVQVQQRNRMERAKVIAERLAKLGCGNVW